MLNSVSMKVMILDTPVESTMPASSSEPITASAAGLGDVEVRDDELPDFFFEFHVGAPVELVTA